MTQRQKYAIRVYYNVELPQGFTSEYYGPYDESEEAARVLAEVIAGKAQFVTSKVPILPGLCHVVPVYVEVNNEPLVTPNVLASIAIRGPYPSI